MSKKILLFLTIFLFSGLAAQGSRDAGLLAFYPFNGNANDSSGNGNHGTVYGATLDYDRFGNWGEAYSFDGWGNKVEIPNTINGLTNLTVESWFKYTDTNNWRWIFGTVPNSVQVGVAVAAGDDKLRYHFNTSNGGFQDGNGTRHLNPNQWYHLGLTYDGVTVKGYVNGVLDFERALTGQVNVNDQLAIGAGLTDGGEWFYGSIDEFRISNVVRDVSEFNLQLPPQNLTANPGNGQVNLKWNTVHDADLAKYRIYRGETQWYITLLDSVMASSPPDTFYVDNYVQNDTTYYYYVTAVDSAGQSNGNSDTVNVTPSASTTVELLAGANTTSTGGQDQGYPLNTYYHDVKHQSLYHAADLSNAGLSPGATINAVDIFPAQSPGMDLSTFRVATAWTDAVALSDSFVTTTVGYGPVYHYPADFPMGAWVRFAIDPIIWNGADNLVVEFSHDNNSYVDGGGIYVRQAGPDRGRRGWSDSQAGDYPFNNNMGSASDDKVAYLQLTYTIADVLPPSNLTAASSYQQVDLSWTASLSDSIANYLIYRGTALENLTEIGSVASTVTTYLDAGLVNGTTYYYGVKTKQIDGDSSAMSTPVSAIPSIETPSNLSASPGSQQVTLTWDAPSGSGVDKTLIYQRTATTTTSLVDSTFDDTTHTKTITGLSNGTTYYFAVKFKGNDGTTSAYSDTVNAIPDYTGPTFWVATDGSTTGDGSSTSPFSTIQHAINKAVSGDTVRIKPGTYSGWGNYDIDFNQKNLVVMGHGGADSVTIDVDGSATYRRRGFKITNYDYSSSAKIVGLHIINGFAPYINDTFNEGGGGILLQSAGSLQIENCKIGPGNRAGMGAGIAITGSNTTISGTVIKGNTITIGSDFYNEGLGAGIYVDGWNQEIVTIQNCVIRGNQGSVQDGQDRRIYGGGLYFNLQVEARVINTLILNNSITNVNYGGQEATGGGAMARNGATVYFIHSTIVGNEASSTAGSSTAGAIAQADPNTAVKVLNSIIWNNTADGDNMFHAWEGEIEVNFSGLQEAHTGSGWDNSALGNAGNIIGDPLFAGTTPNYYALSDASLMIGAGVQYGANYSGGNLIPSVDGLGNLRPDPAGSYPDLGFLENSFATSPVPDAPDGLTATAGDGQVTLSWTKHPENDVTGYGIYYSTSPSPTVAQDTAQGLATTSYIVSGLSNNVTYYFRITAIDSTNYESDFSTEVSAIPQYVGSAIYVDIDSVGATYTPDGSANKPYLSIQAAIDAIDAASIQQILVRPGTYTGSGSNPVVDLKGKNIILESTDGPDTTIISGNGIRTAFEMGEDNLYPAGYTSDTKIIGFTFTNGPSNAHLIGIFGPDRSGGSLTTPWAPVFRNCRFTNSTITATAFPPSVIEIGNAAPAFLNCVFRNLKVEPGSGYNQSYTNLRGPITIEGDETTYSDPVFINCVIAGNSLGLHANAQFDNIYFEGGAIRIGFGTAPLFENTRIDSNTINTQSEGSNDSQALGGGVFIEPYFPNGRKIRFRNCSISYNTVIGKSPRGGGVYTKYPQTRFINCLLVGNALQALGGGDAAGGAIAYYNEGWGTNNGSAAEPVLRLKNCTIADNNIVPDQGGFGGAGIFRAGNDNNHEVMIFNSIIAQNTVSGSSNLGGMNMTAVYPDVGWGSQNSLIDYSIIEYASDAGIIGNFIYETDPKFVGNGDYSLSIASSAIGAGTTQYEGSNAPAYDYNNNIRPNPAGSNPDLGAFEDSLSTSPYPDAPQNLTVSGENDSTVTLSWTANTESDIAKYRIYYGTTSPATTLIDSVSGTNTKTVGSLTNETNYYFRITAVDLEGYESEYSNEITGKPQYKGPVWYVDESAGVTAAGKYGSPSVPFGDIGDALENTLFSSGDTIIVLPGTYDDNDDRNLYAPDFPFVLMSRDGPDATIIELQPFTLAYRFMTFDQGCDTTTQIIGFTIQNGGGYENGGYAHGGAMIIRGTYDWGTQQYTESNPLIKNSIFTGNVADQSNNMNGGAVWIEGSSPVFVDCEFNGNSAPEMGGAILISNRYENNVNYYSAPEFYSNTFTNNQITNTDTWNGSGGAIYSDSPELTFNRCTFLNNSAWNSGGALYVQYGDTDYKWLVIKNSLFAGNSTVATAGYESMGGAFRTNGDNLQLVMEHVTISDNTSTNGGAAIAFKNAFIYNSILWNNSLRSDNSPVEGADGDVEILYSLVENGELVPGFDPGSGLSIDPVFTDADTGDYTLSLASFALGAGTTQYTDPSTGNTVTIDGVDLAGNARIQPNGSNPDMGAYESPEAETPFPDAPTNLTATPLHRSVDLNWNFPVSTNVTQYFVYQSSDSTNWASVDTVMGRLVTRTTVIGLTNETQYYFYVSAVDSAYESQPSNGVSAKPFYQGPVWYVDENATGPLFEGSFDDPIDNIREAIFNTNDGDTVLLRPGVYTGDGNRDLNFQQVDEFWNMTTEPRNLVLMGEKGADSTIIDLSGFGATARRLLEVTSGEGPETKLLGLTVQNGEASDFNSIIKVENSQLIIENCNFNNHTNVGSSGAVVLTGNNQSRITVTGSQFIGNTGTNSVGVFFADNIDISNSIFYQNTARLGAAFGWNPPPGSSSSIVNCLFLENTSTENGSGGAIWIQSNQTTGITIYNSIFWGNIGNPGSDQDISDARNGVHNCLVQNLAAYPTGNYSFDPMILDAGNGDFSLAEFSPAIGIGVAQYFNYTSAQYEDVPALDLFGNSRPNPEGSMPDLGPIENSRWEPRRLVYYVDNNGNDSNDGLSIDFPLLTLAEAFNKSVIRDTIELVDGTYTGAGNRDLNFNGIDRIVRSANGAAATIIDCENLGRAFVFENGETDSTIISGITIQNGVGDNGGAVSITDADPIFDGVVFRNNSASASGGAVYASDSYSEFVNCIFAGNNALESGAVFINDGSVTIDFATAIGNHGDDNISFSGDLSIFNSILWNNSLVDDDVSITYSDVMGGNTGVGNYNGRPGFVDGLNGDFHLQDWSPVIGKASDATGVLYDIEGNTRPGTDPDMGAYESALDTASTYTHQLWYVSTTGSDSVTANMGTESNPYKTIQHAVNNAIYDDEIRILPGYYDESLNNWGKDITFVGNSGVPDDVTIDGLFKITGGSPALYDLHLTNVNGDALQINNDATVTMYNLLITESNVGGITVNNTAIAYMNNMTIYNNATGIYDNSTGLVSVTNSILWNNTASTVGSPTITYSDVEGGYTGTGNINADPDFIAVSNGDFNLKITSPCIDAGDPASTYDNDSTVVDMGAFPLIREFLADTSDGNIIITDDESAVVTDDFTLVANDTLFVEPGADVYFDPGATLTIDGILAASGDPGNPVSFLCSDPDSTYGGVVINTGTGGRDVNNEYSYLLIQDVEAAFVPLTVNGDATLNHITIAGNENATSLEANSGTVSLNYSILEGTTSGSGTVNNVGSYFLSTNQFVDYANGDFTLISSADAIDQDTTENWIDPDYTFSDAGCLYHNQTGYASDSAVVLYPVANNTILISPDTSSTVGTGLVVQAQVFNSIGHYMTNPTVQWSNAGPQNGSFAADNTIGADLRGRVSNTFFTSTTSGDLNSISVDENTTTAQGGYFQVVPGTPDSVWVNEQTDMTMTQLDSLNFGASVFDQFSNLVSDGETVDWSVDTLQGNGDGFTFNEITSTTGNGTVTVTLATDPTGNNLSVGDQVRVQAVSGNGSHQSGLVTVIPDDIYNLTMPPELTESQIDLSADVATIEIETALIDTFDNPLEDVEVYWEVVVGAGTGESLSNTSSFTSAEGIATITLNTSTVANSNYTVRGWVTEDALLSVLLGNQWTSQRPSAVSGVNNFLKSGKRNSGIMNPRSEINMVSLPVRIVKNSSSDNTHSREDRSVYDLDDTTAVIHVIPGVTEVVLFPQDSVDVLLGDQFQITANILDQFGNTVADGTPVAWEIVPANNYVTIENSAASATNGEANIDLLIEQNAPWDFDFVVQLTSEGVTGATGTHNINDVTPPAAVVNMDISPSVWTPTNEFILAWDNPGEHSGIAGAYSRVDTETEVYEAGANISTLSILNRLPDEAASTIKVWLQDNAGNALESNAVTAIAKWDATAPAAFNVTAPLEAWYNTPTLRFEWNASSDATAGLIDYILIIDGSNTYTQHPDSTGMNIPDAFAAGTHTWSVSAFDSAGNETVTSNPQTFYVDFTNPGIAHNPVLEATENSPMTITATFSDDASGIEIAELFYRKGGEVQWQAPIDMSTLNTYQIASSFVTSVGVEYYVYSRDVAGNETYKPDAGYYSSSVTISSPGLSTTAIWPTGIPNGSSVSSYQLLSFPGQAANSTPTDILVDDLGAYDNTKWRFFEYGGSGAWTEFANISSIKPGTGYFLIVKDPSLNINTGQTRSVESDQDYQINLSSGDWIMFGNPFDFSIPLDNVYIDDTTNLVGDANLLTYDGSWTETTVIEPWTGYIYKSGTASKIFIKPRKSNGSFAKQIVQEIVFQENEWLVDIIARNGLGMDKLNTVGVLADAMDEYDEFDAFEPPMLPGGVSLRMNNTGWAQNPDIYTKDIRSIKEDGEYWDIEVAAEDDKYNTYLYFEGIEDIPADFDVFVIDVTLGIAQDLRWSPVYRYAVINPKSIHDIRFIAGTREFVKINNAGVDLYPDRYSISQNFPNPFNPQTSILITLEDMATVDLIVYNILGEEVIRILDNELRPAGYHNIIWKGLNDNGKRVASGVYFYTTRIKSTSGNMILNKTNKMIMVK